MTTAWQIPAEYLDQQKNITSLTAELARAVLDILRKATKW